MSDKIHLQRNIAEPKKLREPVPIDQTETTQEETHRFSVSSGGRTYSAGTREELAAIVSTIRNHSIRLHGAGLAEVHERHGVFTALLPNGISVQASGMEQLRMLVSQFYPVVTEA